MSNMFSPLFFMDFYKLGLDDSRLLFLLFTGLISRGYFELYLDITGII